MGELHLEIIVDRLKREFHVDADVGKPQVAYRETIKQMAEGEGNTLNNLVVVVNRSRFATNRAKERGTGYEFVNEIKGGTVPREYIEPTNKGVQEALERGFLANYPMVDIRVTLYDGSYHEVDSSELAFKMAGSFAMRDAVSKADMVLIEPIMKVEVSTPEEFMGDVIGDLGSRRAQIQGTNKRGNISIITALAPLAEMQGYVTTLRGLTQGRATSVLLPSHYEEVPRNITEAIIEERKGKKA
jgi:elongation factor G